MGRRLYETAGTTVYHLGCRVLWLRLPLSPCMRLYAPPRVRTAA